MAKALKPSDPEKGAFPSPASQSPTARTSSRTKLLAGAALLLLLFLAPSSSWAGLSRLSAKLCSHLKTSPGPVDWHPCPQNASYSCGWLEVPKDYFNR